MARNGKIIEASTLLDGLGAKAAPYDVQTRLLLRQALYDFDRYSKSMEETVEFHRAYGRLLYRAGRLPDALIVIQRAIVLDGQDTELHNFLAQMFMQLGNQEGVITTLKKSLEINPDQPNVAQQLQNLEASAPPPPGIARPSN